MRTRTEDQLTEKLHQTNQRLHLWLEKLAGESAHSATPQLIDGLLTEMRETGERLRVGLPAEKGFDLQAELVEYRSNLEWLRGQMPAIHRHLLEERARLEAERSRIASAVEWAQGSSQTV